MAGKRPVPTPRYCIQHSRLKKQDGWRLYDLSLSLDGNTAVTGYNENTYRIYIDVCTNVRHSDSRNKPKIIYSKEFEKYEDEDNEYYGRLVSFYPGSDTTIISGLGDKLEVIDLIQDRVIKSRKIKLVNHGGIRCLSVRKTEIFIGFVESNKITVYDVIDLNEIKSIILQGIQDGYWPGDMTAIADRLFVCITDGKEESNQKSLIFDEKNGRILSELTKPTDTVKWYVEGLALNITLNVIAVAWSQTYEGESKGVDVIVFYSLLSENNCSFLISEVEFGVARIRISDRGDRIVWRNRVTEECKVCDMAEILTYRQLKRNLASLLQLYDCVRLINYFALPKDQSEAILNSRASTENLLSVLEERGDIQPSYIDRLIEAFRDLKISSSCYYLVDFYKKTRVRVTSYDKFLATLSAHLIASLPSNLCDYFNITDENKTSIVSSQNPGLSLLLSLDEIGIIKQSKVAALELPFNDMKLIQAVAMIHEYQSIVQEEKVSFLGGIEIADERKRDFFIQCLQRKIKNWYETMSPVPWRKSCKWSVSDLFVGSGLILTDSKSKRSLLDVDEKCKVEAKEIFSHERLKYETRIILEGDPGCGKTMLMSQLAYDWSQGKLNDIKLLIFLPLKFVQQRTLVEAIKEFYLPEDKHSLIRDIEKFLDDKDNPAHLLLDGLEEYSGKEKYEKSEVRDIISRKKYPCCKLLISSRSDFGKDLPKIPMLKLGRFGENERRCYIEKLFPEDSKKQMGTKQIIDDSPIIQDLCSVPLLFVLAVHNVENMEKAQVGRLDRVTPFVKDMVDTLCPIASLITKTQALVLGRQGQKEISLEELAFNGLCRGNQQLYWQKEFFDEKIQNSKEWIDSGVLVIDESTYSVPIDKEFKRAQSVDTDASYPIVSRGEDSAQCGLGEVAEGQSDVDINLQLRAGEDSDRVLGTTANSYEADTTISLDDDDTSSDEDDKESMAAEEGVSIAKYVPLQVRFLHKIIQEWFAAKYFSSLISRVNVDHAEKYSYKHLPLINPADLHHVLRFTCALYPPSCHIIIKHLLSYRTDKSDVPKYIMNCIFLCLAEYAGDYNCNILEVLSEICMENIMIHCDDSRLLQQSKVMVLKIASSHGIKTRKLLMAELVTSAKEDVLQFNSGIMMNALKTLEEIELSRWDQTLKEEDYSNILKFIAKFPMLRKASLEFPHQPPRVDKGTAVSLQEKDQTVMWIIGSKLSYVLDPATRKWKLLGEKPPDAQKQNTEADENVDMMTDLHKKKSIDETGGTLFLYEADVSLHVPKGALKQRCVLHVTVPSDPRVFCLGHGVIPRTTPLIICEPDNLQFHVPVKLTVPHCAVLKYPRNHTVEVKFGHTAKESTREMTWSSETVKYSLGEHYCSVFLEHFSGVDIIVGSVKEKILRVIPYIKLGQSGKHVLNVWICNDLESDFQSVMQTEEKNEGLPLDSYDTFRLRFVSKPGDILNVHLNVLEGSSWRPDKNEAKVINTKRLLTSKKSKCNFRLVSDGEDDESYMYFRLRVTQTVGDEKTETTFALRKRICDLKMPVKFIKPFPSTEKADHLFSTDNEGSVRPYTAVVYMDPVKHLNDDVITTLWLWPFDSTTEIFKCLQEEQELQYRHQVDSENSFTIIDEKLDIVTKTQFLNGHWLLSPDEMKIETDRVRFGSRAKFQFIGKRDRLNGSEYITLQVDTFQVQEQSITFIADVELKKLLYDKRQKEIEEIEKLKASAKGDDSKSSCEDHSYKPFHSQTKPQPSTSSTVINNEPSQSKQGVDGNIPPPGTEVNTKTKEERLQDSFMFVKENLVQDWQNVGRVLKLTDSQLDRLILEHPRNVQERIYQMLRLWQRENGASATPERLIDALIEIKNKKLAEDLAAIV